jgi:Cu-processing system permease protein
MFTQEPTKKAIAITSERFAINDLAVMEKPIALSDSPRSSLLLRLLKYVLLDILKNKMMLFYTVFLFAVSFGILSMSGDAVKGIASLLNILLLVTPLLSIIFSTIYFYNSYEFIEVLASQPIRRRTILLSHYCGLCLSLLLSLFIGAGIPLFIYAPEFLSLTLLMTTGALTMVFVSLAMVAALYTRDKAKGIGLSILLWFYFSILYDALMLMIMFAFIDYPLEKATLAMIALNPVDLARTVVLLQMDISALMGYTGALMQDIMGNHAGVLAAGCIMGLWILLPLLLAVRKFNRRDF